MKNDEKEAFDKLVEQNEKYKKILNHIFADKTGHYFICGDSTDKDEYGLPSTILICPRFGDDGFAVYKKVKDYSAPEY